MSALKPCPNPFCAHSSPKIWQGAVAKKWRGTCRQCHIETAAFDTEAEAITAWNTRSPVTDEMVERAVLAILKAQRDLGADPISWDDATDAQKSDCKTVMNAALTAALGGPHG